MISQQQEQSSDVQKPGRGRLKGNAMRSLEKYLTGRISRTTLLTTLLPLSFASFFGALIGAALIFPKAYDWQVRVISSLTSPRENPHGYWLASVGIMGAILLMLPFAGYLGERLRALSPRLARLAHVAFAISFVTMIFSMLAQLAQPFIGLRWLHEMFARVASVNFILGMFCCSACAIKDRLRNRGARAWLPPALAYSWATLTLLPILCVAAIGLLVLLGQQAGLIWVENFRHSFRGTPLWHLAFWEWIAIAIAFAFLTVSVLLLPAYSGKRRTASNNSFVPDETATGPFLPQPERPL
jgi:hypothetical protein